MNKQIPQGISSVLQRPAAQKASVFAVALLVIGAVSYFGAAMQQGSEALTPPPTTLYISPETGSFVQGSTVSATIRVTSGTEPINVVQASMNYNASQLQFVSITEGTAFPTAAATSTDTPGVIRVSRANQMSPVSGDNAVVTVNFKMLSSSGAVALSFDPAYSYVVRSTDNTNILAGTTGASFTARLPQPTAVSVSPNSGPASGGTVVTITGTNFVSGATVKVGTSLATGVTFVSSTSIKATVPAHSFGGVKDVVVTNPDGQVATLVNGFTYNVAPSVSAIKPAEGPLAGGTRIALTGTGFVAGTTVQVGGVAATFVDVAGSTSLTATTPARSTAGTVQVTVTNPDGQKSATAVNFVYMNPAPTVSAVTPNSGYTAGGQAVTITGSGFSPNATVTIGGVAASSIIVVNPTTITAKAPSGAVGVASVVVRNLDGQSGTLASAYTYKKAGDVGGDGRVNALDLSVLISKDSQAYGPADFNGDGTVGSADMAILLAAWTW